MEFTKSQIEESVDLAISKAIEGGYITENSSRREVLNNSYEILEFMDIDTDYLTDSQYEYAERYLVENF